MFVRAISNPTQAALASLVLLSTAPNFPPTAPPRFYRFPNRRHGNKAHKRLFPTKMLKTKAQRGNNQAAVS